MRGQTGEPDALTDEARREPDSASAALDTAFDALRRDRVERAVRWIGRAGRLLMAPFRALKMRAILVDDKGNFDAFVRSASKLSVTLRALDARQEI